MAGEFERIARLRAIYGEAHAGVALGIGDDAAILEPGIVLSVDAAVDEVHFRRRWVGQGARWEDIGARATLAALSDLAAMGARPRAVLQALTLPADLDEAALDALAQGAAHAASAHGAVIVGGNLAGGATLSITTTVVGATDGRPALTRSGAKVGDAVFVTGPLGGAALGLAILEGGPPRDEDEQRLVRRFLSPPPRSAWSRREASRLHAAIDVSDGLLQDLEHLATASGVGIEVFADAIPLEPAAASVAAARGRDALALALGGGEDFELVVVGPDDLDRPELTRIGRVVERVGVAVIGADGGTSLSGRRGFDHFR